MSDTFSAPQVPGMDEALSDFGVTADAPSQGPIAPLYRIDAMLKVPVSKAHGTVWKGRIGSAKTSRQQQEAAWDEAIKYYNNSQQDHREATDPGQVSGNRYYSKRRNNKWSETENIVYANVQSILPATYAKNPQATFTTDVVERKEWVKLIERVTNRLASMKHTPGLNLKPHAKQMVVSAEICNVGWLYYGYTQRADSSMGAQDELAKLSDELSKAKDTKTVLAIEGKLISLEERLTLVSNPGPWCRYVPPHDVLVDGNSTAPDHSDANWVAVRERYRTSYLNAVYGKPGADDKIMSVFKPTEVLLGGKTEGVDDMANFRLFDPKAEAKAYGYDNTDQMRNAQMTTCWRIFDKVTRRVFLYADNQWDWPIWAENDPYGLPDMIPLVPLVFIVTPIGNQARSSVTYYLDQQDALNEIHDEKRRARQEIKDNILFDDRFNREAMVEYLNGGSGTARGVKVPDGMKLSDLLHEKPNAMMKVLQLFDPNPIYASIDRLSGTSEVQRNGQFKTNTTNKAIENYNASTAMRLDAKIDAIEDALGSVFYGIAFLCAQFMTDKEVANLVGSEAAAQWQQFGAEELRNMFTCQVIGGSTQKPTSAAKKQQALEIAQVLQPFAQFAPTVVLHAVTQMMDKSFDEVELPPDTFMRIEQEAIASMGGGGGNAPPGEEAAPAGTDAGGSAAPQQAQQQVDPAMIMQQIADQIDALPPEAKLALGQAIAQGAPIAEVLPMIMEAAASSGGGMSNGMAGGVEPPPTMQ